MPSSKGQLPIGVCYMISTSKGPLYKTIKSAVGDDYTCDVTGGAKDVEQTNVRGSELRRGTRVRVNQKRRRGDEADGRPLVVSTSPIRCALPDDNEAEESSYISPAKMVIRAALVHYALLYHGRTGNRPLIGLIDHDRCGAVEYWKNSYPEFFKLADFVAVNFSDASCVVLQEKFAKDENVHVVCGSFARVIEGYTHEAPDRKFNILWADICNELEQPELEVFKSKVSCSGMIMYTHSTRSGVLGRDVQEVLKKIERMHKSAGLPEYEKYRYQNGRSTMIHVEVPMHEQRASTVASPWLHTALVAGLRTGGPVPEGLLASLVWSPSRRVCRALAQSGDRVDSKRTRRSV